MRVYASVRPCHNTRLCAHISITFWSFRLSSEEYTVGGLESINVGSQSINLSNQLEWGGPPTQEFTAGLPDWIEID